MAGGKDFMARTTFALALLPSNLSRILVPCTDVPMCPKPQRGILQIYTL